MRLRLFLAALILFALLYFVGRQELIATVRAVEPLYLLILAALSYLLIWVSCIKWRLFLNDSDISIHYLMRLYTVGYFINLFAPSFVGGDAVRSYQLGKKLSDQRDAAVATFLERYTGLLAMTTLGVIFVICGNAVAKGIEAAVFICWFATVMLGAVAVSSRVRSGLFLVIRRLGRVAPQLEVIKKSIDAIERGLAGAREKRELFGRALLWSFAFHILAVLNTYAAARAVGWEDVDIAGLFVTVPLVLIISLVPITPAGIGIQEGAFMFLLSRIGATDGQALGVGILLRLKAVILGIIGGVFWLFERKDTR